MSTLSPLYIEFVLRGGPYSGIRLTKNWEDEWNQSKLNFPTMSG